jgi:hypothetical protein
MVGADYSGGLAARARGRPVGNPTGAKAVGWVILDKISIDARSGGRGNMVGRIIIIVVLVVVVGGVAFLATRDIPAPSAQVEKVIPNDRALHP